MDSGLAALQRLGMTRETSFPFRGGLVAQIREIIGSYDLVQQVLEREIGPLIVGARAD